MCTSINWSRFLEIAEQHNVIPHVYGTLSRMAEGSSTRVLLARHYENHLQRALWFSAELARVVKHLREKRVRLMAYKGPGLAQFLYGDAACRQFSDLDLLVLPGDVARAKIALGGLGYKLKTQVRAANEQAYVASGYEYAFDGPGGPNSLEMQWRILPHFYAVDFNFTEMFRRALTVEVADEPVPTVGYQDLPLVLCVHAAKHEFTKLGWLCDISQLVKQPVDWNKVKEDSQRLGISRIVALSFLLCRNLLNTRIPDPIENLIRRDPRTLFLAQSYREMIFRSGDHETISTAYFRRMLHLRERWQDRAKFLSRLVLTPGIGEWKSMNLPVALSPFYRFVRLARLSRKLLQA